MALEISEIGIRMSVGDTVSDTVSKPPDKRKAGSGKGRDIDREEIVEDCLRRVLQVLKTMEER